MQDVANDARLEQNSRKPESSNSSGGSAGTSGRGWERPNTQDQLTKLKPHAPLRDSRKPLQGASMKQSQRQRARNETRLPARPYPRGKTELTRRKTRRQAGTGTGTNHGKAAEHTNVAQHVNTVRSQEEKLLCVVLQCLRIAGLPWLQSECE